MDQNFISTTIGDEEVHVPMEFGKYQTIKIIGTGSFSVVALVIDKHTQQQYACKVCSRKMLIENEIFDRFEREVRILQVLHHPNIVALEDVVFDEKLIFLIMEYCQKGELFQFIIDNSRINEKLARRMFLQIVNAISYIHSREIAHRDMKPENVLLDKNLNVKIADFGLCHPDAGSLMLKTPCGSPFYAPPEVINNDQYDGKASDIWSIGVVLFTMITGALPWRETNQTSLFLQIQNADYSVPRFVSPEARDLIKRLMALNPAERPTADQIHLHPWFTLDPDLENEIKQREAMLPPKLSGCKEQKYSNSYRRQAPVLIRPNMTHSAQAYAHVPQPIAAVIRKVPRLTSSLTRKSAR